MRFVGLLAGALALFAAPVGFAQTTSTSAAARAALKAAFEETLRKPADPPTLLRYAEAAIEAGDLEAAISALERLLLIDNDQPRVKLELGVLYYRLGSYEAARSYLEGAQASARAPAEVKERAAQYLAEIDSKIGRSQFSGDLMFGIRYSNNANSGPAGLISSAGTPTVPDTTTARREDFNVVGVAVLRHRYDLGRQDGGAFETDFTFYKARQFQVSEAHILFTDLVLGPKVEPFDGWLDDMAVKPFFMGRYVSVHDLPTYWAWGTGIEASGPLSEKLRAAATVFGRHRAFINNADSSINDRSSGTELVGTLEFRLNLAQNVTLGLNGTYTRYIAQVASESYAEYGIGSSLAVRFTDPLGINGRLWSVTATGQVLWANYDQVDAAVDPVIRRQQTDLNLGLVLGVPLDAQLSVIAQATYTQRHASVNNYAYDAFAAMLALGWRF